MPKKICFFSDTDLTINLYRSDLAELCRSKGYDVVYGSLSKLFRSVLKVFLADLIVSSNLRANIISLALFHGKRRLVILNGLGRSRESKVLRKFLYCLFRFNKKTTLIVQNYRDFRWLRRLNISSYYISGSGGLKLEVNQSNANRWVIITRESKVKKQLNSIRDFSSALNRSDTMIAFYGLSKFETNDYIQDVFTEFNGIVTPSRFFLQSDNFFQPEGYSEGFPHTLAHAIVSGCNIFIPKKLYIQYGLYEYDLQYNTMDKFISFEARDCSKLRSNLSLPVINNSYLNVILKLVS